LDSKLKIENMANHADIKTVEEALRRFPEILGMSVEIGSAQVHHVVPLDEGRIRAVLERAGHGLSELETFS
jgi:hypothetical protein